MWQLMQRRRRRQLSRSRGRLKKSGHTTIIGSRALHAVEVSTFCLTNYYYILHQLAQILVCELQLFLLFIETFISFSAVN